MFFSLKNEKQIKKGGQYSVCNQILSDIDPDNVNRL